MPAFVFELLAHALVASTISLELLLPVFDIALGCGRVLAVFMMMPEAAVHKDRDLAARKGDIRMPNALLPIAAISTPANLAQHMTHDKFGFRIDPPVCNHRVMNGLAYHAPNDSA